MYHFVSLIWNPLDGRARSVAARLSTSFKAVGSDWESSFHVDGMVVWTIAPRDRAMRTYRLPTDSGVILGRLFPAKLNSVDIHQNSELDERGANDVIQSRGRSLLSAYWGNYVAFIRPQDTDRCYVARDCSGKIPCYRTRFENVEILFSDVADLTSFALPSFTLNREYLAAFIYSSELQVRECALREVTEVLAGDCVEFHNGASRQVSIWNPISFCKDPSIEGYDDAALALQTTTQRCIETWAAVHESILHRLSGGLDSSIVLGCLARSPVRPRITCINSFSTMPGEDERRYARLSAARAGVTLVEHPLSSGKAAFDSQLFSLPRTVKPAVPHLFVRLFLDDANDAARTLRADSVWTGQGGDHLFLDTNSDISAADYLFRRGIGRGFLSAIADAALLSKRSYLSVFRQARSLVRSRTRWTPDFDIVRQGYFLNRDALPRQLSEYISNPWMLSCEAIPPGKQSQVFYLAEVVNRQRPLPRLEYAYEHHPLLSQPLIELCLRIPTYLLLRGGRQRALARDIFKDRVPAEIIAREDKGGMTHTVMASVRQSATFIRDVLMDGNLVREGIVDRRALEPHIVHGDSLREGQMYPLVACLAAEIWSRSWLGTAMRIAA